MSLRDFGLGLVLAIAAGLVLVAQARWIGAYGWAFVVGLPVAMGFVLGYVSGVSRALAVWSVLVVLASVLASAIWLEIAGGICALVAGTVLLVPTLAGALLGAFARKRTGGRHTRVACLVIVLGCAAAAAIEQRLTPGASEEQIVTTRILDMPRERAWEVLMFYEDVDIEPPVLARIGLPHAVRTHGKMSGVSDVVRCEYSTGFLRKRITEWVPGSQLGFDVIEQVGIENRSIELTRGSFSFAETDDGRTEVTLRTFYRPLLSARPVWRPFEQSLGHVLHGHVLDGMEAASRARGFKTARVSAP